MTRHTTICVLLCLFLLAAAFSGRAQDTLAIYRDFIRASKAWQQQPLQLEIQMSNRCNVVTREEDTITTQASFYIGAQAAYIRFGEVEQLVNDSQALLVSNKLKRMVFYSNAAPILTAARSLSGLAARDSSLLPLAARYTAQVTTTAGNRTIVLTGRRTLAGTTLPVESVEMMYDLQTGIPAKVITTKRTLVPLTQEDHAALERQHAATIQLAHPEADKYFMVKELVNTTIYIKISHDPNVKMPFAVTDRIGRSNEGNLLPAKTYEHYTISVN